MKTFFILIQIWLIFLPFIKNEQHASIVSCNDMALNSQLAIIWTDDDQFDLSLRCIWDRYPILIAAPPIPCYLNQYGLCSYRVSSSLKFVINPHAVASAYGTSISILKLYNMTHEQHSRSLDIRRKQI